MSDPIRDKHLVTSARTIERLHARRRKLRAELRNLDELLRTHHKLLRDLTTLADTAMGAGLSCEDVE